MRFGEDEWWPDLENVPSWARRADEHALPAQAVDDTPADRLLPRSVVVELDADEEARPANVTDHSVRRRDLGEAGTKVGADALGLLGEPLALDHVQHGGADRSGDRRSGEGREEMPARGELGSDRRRRDHGAHRVAIPHR